ncbi:hypothetical protein HK100_003622 [Physocladia obscura]|uniref:Uncharacterized protein n=1 Tax=Physocladia obscura TaxID=109957 RepID=A0AAD5XDF7_9FUNG|nr:hypothetical protein HK100_003622 [Physocladia obscura]
MSVSSPRLTTFGLSREKSITQNSNNSKSIPAVPLPSPPPIHLQIPKLTPTANNTAARLSVDSDSDDSYWDLDIGFAPQAAVLDVTATKTWHPNNSTSGRRSVDLREYHAIDSSNYTLPSDETEQSRIELEHYMLRHVFKK